MKSVKFGNKMCGRLCTNVGPRLFYLDKLLIAKIINSTTDRRMNGKGHRSKYWENIYFQFHFWHRNSHINWPGFEPGERTATGLLSRGLTCPSFVIKESGRNGLLKMPILILNSRPFV
jgi:hypothetical protein